MNPTPHSALPHRSLLLALLTVAIGAGVYFRDDLRDQVDSLLSDPANHPWLKRQRPRGNLALARDFDTPPERPWTIVLDAGHGGPRKAYPENGTAAEYNTTQEKDINLSKTLAVAKRLRARPTHFKVVLTRDTDVAMGIGARPRVSNRLGADAFLSFHGNAVGKANVPEGTPAAAVDRLRRARFRGFMVIWSSRQTTPAAAEASPWLAAWTGAALTDAGFTPYTSGAAVEDVRFPTSASYVLNWPRYGSWATAKNKLGVLDHNRVPAILIESHFLSSPDDVADFQRPERIAQFAEAVELGLLNYFAHRDTEPATTTEGHWAVQVEALPARSDADKLVKDLEAKGLEARVEEHVGPTAIWFRVRVGKSASRDVIETMLDTVRTRAFVDSQVVFQEETPNSATRSAANR